MVWRLHAEGMRRPGEGGLRVKVNYKVYRKDESGKANAVLETADYEEACRKEKEIQDKGSEAFVWQV